MMKKYFIGFIIAMISIIPISSASALELSDGTVVPDIPSDSPNYVITTKSDGTIRMFCWTDSSEIYVYTTSSLYFSKVLSTNFNNYTYLHHNLVTVYTLSNGEWVDSGFTSNTSFSYQTINATTDNIYNKDLSVYYEAGYGLASDKTINISSRYVTDPDTERTVGIITTDFSEVYDSNYKYQIKTDYTEWKDITDDISDTSYSYNYSLGYNTTFYARVLDSSDNVLYENSIDITALYDKYFYNKTLSTNQYSGLEFNFELPNSTSTQYQCSRLNTDDPTNPYTEYYNCISIDYEMFNSDANGNLNTMPFGIPYFEKTYLYDTGSSSVTKVDTIPLNDIVSSNYNGTYELEIDATITGLKLIIPFEYLKYSYVTVNLESNLNYEVSYIERETEEVNYSSVDITGKAGVMFIPKQITEDMLLGFNFDMSSTYSVQLRDTYMDDYNILSYYSVGYCTENELNDIPVICSSGSNGYQVYINFPKDNLEQSVFVLNRNYPKENTAKVYYDSRYFDYVVYDSLTSTPTFTHPITGEEETGNSLLDFNDKLYKEQNDGFFQEFKGAFDNFKDVISEITGNISYFFENLNQDLKYFYMVIFGLVLFGFLIRFIL